MHRRNVLVALVALLATLPLTACSARLPDPATAVKAATQNAAEAKTVRFAITTEYRGVEDAEYAGGELEGAFDFQSGNFEFVASVVGEEMSWRQVGDTAYIRSAWLGDEQWVEFPDELGLDMFGELLAIDPDDPFAILSDFGANASQLRRHHSEELRGRNTTRYAGVVLAEDLEEDPVFPTDSDHISFELWIDEQNLPAQLRMTFEIDPEEEYLEPIAGETPEVVFTLEFFDWGEPVEIEAPAADEIMDLDDDPFGGGSFGDPFEGAKCYGDRVAECLGVNAELDARADDPALCQGPEARVCLVPVGNVRADIVDAIVKFHKETANIDVLVLASIPMADHWVTPESQVTEYEVYNIIKHVYGVTDDTASTFIGITPIDIVPEDGDYGWMFGARFGQGANGHNHGVFSTFRMENVEPYDGSGITDELVQLRASKYFGRYVALLHLDWPAGDDIDYLNYGDMFGFSDLDSIGTKWPSGEKPCVSDTPMICVIPDGEYLDFEFEADLERAVERLSTDLGIRIELRKYAGFYYATEGDWGEEYAGDLRETMAMVLNAPNVTVIGVTDDALSQSASLPDYLERVWAAENLAVVSGWDAGTPGNDRHEDRLYRLLLRAIAQAHYGEPLNSDPTNLLFDGVTKPADLDGLTAPALP